MRVLVTLFLLATGHGMTTAQSPPAAPDGAATSAAPSPDSAAVVATVDAFHTALAEGDTATVRRLLARDVLVLESGGLEDRAEYFSHHLPADMAFAAAVPDERDVARVEVNGDAAWVVATSQRRGTFRDREVNSRGAELVILRRGPEGWRITAIHWSSRSQR